MQLKLFSLVNQLKIIILILNDQINEKKNLMSYTRELVNHP